LKKSENKSELDISSNVSKNNNDQNLSLNDKSINVNNNKSQNYWDEENSRKLANSILTG